MRSMLLRIGKLRVLGGVCKDFILALKRAGHKYCYSTSIATLQEIILSALSATCIRIILKFLDPDCIKFLGPIAEVCKATCRSVGVGCFEELIQAYKYPS
jgi:hypothetical protein